MELLNKRTRLNSFSALLLSCIFLSTLLTGCGQQENGQYASENNDISEVELTKGPHGGRLLITDDFTLELSIFETGVPPEFRAWASFKGLSLNPSEVELKVTLTRLSSNDSNRVNEINFKPYGDAMRGDGVIYEPHSFVVNISALHKGQQYNWQYDNFEGRTKIEATVAEALEIETEEAGPAVLQETIDVFGNININPERASTLHARFDGVIKSVSVSMGDIVRKGQTLATIESNESLKVYAIKAPINGVVTQRHANIGEQTDGRVIFVITDTSTVWVNLSIFPADIDRVKIGALVTFKHGKDTQNTLGEISSINVIAEANQSISARMVINNEEGLFLPGHYIKAKIKVAEHAVQLAVKRSGLQAFRDFTVVYAQVGDEYEVRMLELGKQDSEWVEVRSGLEKGTRYVSGNSYVIKADIEKSGASHDH